MSDKPMTVQVDIDLAAEMIARDLHEHPEKQALRRVAEASARLCAKLLTSIECHSTHPLVCRMSTANVGDLLPLIAELETRLLALPPNTPVPAPCCDSELPAAWHRFCVEESKPAVANHCPPGDDSKSLQWLPLPESSNAKIGAAAPLCGPLEPSERRNSEAPTSGVRVAVNPLAELGTRGLRT